LQELLGQQLSPKCQKIKLEVEPRAAARRRGPAIRLPAHAVRRVLNTIFLFPGVLQRRARWPACCAAAHHMVGFTKRSLEKVHARAARVWFTM